MSDISVVDLEIAPDEMKAKVTTAPEVYLDAIKPYQEVGLPGNYSYTLHQKDQKIDVTGMVHTKSYDDRLAEFDSKFRDSPPDVLFVEGEAKMLDEIKDQTDGNAVLAERGESAYMAWVGLKAEVPVVCIESWDLPYIEQIKKGLEQYPAEVVAAVTIGQGLVHVLRQPLDGELSRGEMLCQEIIKLDENILPLIEDSLGRTLDDQAIQDILSKYSSYDLTTMTAQDASNLIRPDGRGIINQASAYETLPRDENAISKIYEAKQKYKNIQVIAGSAHAVVWEPALRKMYEVTFRDIINDPEYARKLVEGSSVYGVDFQGWEDIRRFIADAIDRDGTILDVDCANGFLLRCLQEWSGHNLIPFGIDSNITAREEAKKILPEYANNIFKGDLNRMVEQTDVRSFDFVYWNVWDNYEFTPENQEIVRQLYQRAVSPGGRLILGFYNEDPKIRAEKIKKIEEMGFEIGGHIKNPTGEQELIWIDKPASSTETVVS